MRILSSLTALAAFGAGVVFTYLCYERYGLNEMIEARAVVESYRGQLDG